MKPEMITNLEARGFNRWTKGALDRLYINAAQLGLVCQYRSVGSISGATFCGDEISNSEARRMKAAKTFIDLATDTVYSDNAALAHRAAEMTGLSFEARSWDTVIKLESKEEI